MWRFWDFSPITLSVQQMSVVNLWINFREKLAAVNSGFQGRNPQVVLENNEFGSERSLERVIFDRFGISKLRFVNQKQKFFNVPPYARQKISIENFTKEIKSVEMEKTEFQNRGKSISMGFSDKLCL